MILINLYNFHVIFTPLSRSLFIFLTYNDPNVPSYKEIWNSFQVLDKNRLRAFSASRRLRRNKSHQHKLLLNLQHLSFFSQKLGNTELYKVPIERLHVRKETENARSWKNQGVGDGSRRYPHGAVSAPGKRGTTQSTSLNGEERIQRMEHEPLRCQRQFMYSGRTKKKRKKPENPCEVRAGVKYRPRHARRRRSRCR